MKPLAATPAVTPEQSKKSGTTVVKAAPPKETARITVKPSLPSGATARPAGGGNIPTVKPATSPAAGTVPVAAAALAASAAAAATPKPGAATPAGVAKPVAAKPMAAKSGTKPISAAPIKPGQGTPVAGGSAAITAANSGAYVEESEGGSTLTTALAGILALITWATAGVLWASYLGYLG